MHKLLAAAVAATLAAGGAAFAAPPPSGPPAPWHGCIETPHSDDDPCPCRVSRTFYTPGPAWSVHAGGGPGVYVTSPPVTVPSGRIDIEGPPIYVEAPPVRVEPVHIYIRAPDVRVRPSHVTVDPPVVHFEGCPEDSPCTAGGE